MSMQIGRVPSCLPQEYLRTRSSFRQGANFEDGVIFVHDMERCLGKLDRVSGELVERIGIQEYSRREAAQILGMSHGQLSRSYDDAIDRLTEILLGHQLIRQSSASY
jgi:DNA-directed RNA polymerase specialized sigma24 family protein